jgi:hypothetical protein
MRSWHSAKRSSSRSLSKVSVGVARPAPSASPSPRQGTGDGDGRQRTPGAAGDGRKPAGGRPACRDDGVTGHRASRASAQAATRRDLPGHRAQIRAEKLAGTQTGDAPKPLSTTYSNTGFFRLKGGPAQAHRGAYPDRQRRGAGCSGRGSVRRASELQGGLWIEPDP